MFTINVERMATSMWEREFNQEGLHLRNSGDALFLGLCGSYLGVYGNLLKCGCMFYTVLCMCILFHRKKKFQKVNCIQIKRKGKERK